MTPYTNSAHSSTESLYGLYAGTTRGNTEVDYVPMGSHIVDLKPTIVNNSEKDFLSKPHSKHSSATRVSSKKRQSERTVRQIDRRSLALQNIDINAIRIQQRKYYSHHFLDFAVRPLTWDYVKTMMITVVMVAILMWCTLPLYWGSLANGNKYGPDFRVWVVDFDGGELGAYITQSALNSAASTGIEHLGWQNVTFDSVEDVINGILDEKSWGAIVINPNATQLLQASRASGDPSYDPTSAVTLYIEQARNENAVNMLINPFSTSLLHTTLRQFNVDSLAAFVQSFSGNPSALQVVANSPATTSGVWYNTVNLRPFNAPVAGAITVVGQIYMIYFTYIMTLITVPARAVLEPYLTNQAVLLLRVASPLLAYMPLSLSYSMISLPFHAPFGTKFTYAGGFFIYLCFVYLVMCAVGLATEAAVTFIPPKFMAFFLVSWIFLNLSTPVEPHEMENTLYRYGYAMPFYNHANAARTVLFDVKNVLGRNAGILFAWIAISIAITTIFTWYWRHEKVWQHRAGIIVKPL